jgi:hypothetical protein
MLLQTSTVRPGGQQPGQLHFPFVQAPGAKQSVVAPQSLPSPHPVHEPPQSTSVSAPFFTPSLHDAVWHVPFLQTPF